MEEACGSWEMDFLSRSGKKRNRRLSEGAGEIFLRMGPCPYRQCEVFFQSWCLEECENKPNTKPILQLNLGGRNTWGDGLPKDQIEWPQDRSHKESCFKAVKAIDSSF